MKFVSHFEPMGKLFAVSATRPAPNQFVTIFNDITQRRADEERLQLHVLVLDQIQDHVTVTDLDGVFTYVNQAQKQVLRADFTGQHVSSYGDGPAADATQDEVAAATLKNGGWRGTVVKPLADGRQILLDLRTTLVRDKDGQPVAMVGVGTDITERKHMERELQQREQYQRVLLDNFPYAVWLKDTKSRFLTVNQGFVKLFGQRSANDLVGKNDFDIAPVQLAEGYRADDRDVLASGKKKAVEEEIIDAEGRRKWFETYKAPVFDAAGSVVGTVGFARDITERREAAQALADISAALAQSRDLLQKIISEPGQGRLPSGRRIALAERLGRPPAVAGVWGGHRLSRHHGARGK